MTTLVAEKAVQTNLFIKVEVDGINWLFSDLNDHYTIGTDDYIGVGNFMAVTSTKSELRVSSGEVTITLSGIPNSAISEVLNAKLKGSPVKIYRAFFDANTGAELDLANNPLLKYRGYVNNYALNEDWDQASRTSSNTIQLICASSIDQLQYKISGRKTNPTSNKKFFASDVSMDRVPNLENATFDFGAPK